VTRQAFAKHLAVTERAGLVSPETQGREVRYGVDEEQFARATMQLAAVGRTWDSRLQWIKAMAESLQRVANSNSTNGQSRGRQ
jgi:DNA-binding transcriptional ArsR family regulator